MQLQTPQSCLVQSLRHSHWHGQVRPSPEPNLGSGEPVCAWHLFGGQRGFSQDEGAGGNLLCLPSCSPPCSPSRGDISLACAVSTHVHSPQEYWTRPVACFQRQSLLLSRNFQFPPPTPPQEENQCDPKWTNSILRSDSGSDAVMHLAHIILFNLILRLLI